MTAGIGGTPRNFTGWRSYGEVMRSGISLEQKNTLQVNKGTKRYYEYGDYSGFRGGIGVSFACFGFRDDK